ncbi:MAG: RNA pseudouridine synthase, partial [Planctomycetota bacterium]
PESKPVKRSRRLMPLEIPTVLRGESVAEALAICFPELPRREIQRLFGAGAVRRTGGLPVGMKTPAAEVFDLDLDAEAFESAEKTLVSADSSWIVSLYESERLLVIDKPAGRTVIPARAKEDESCLSGLLGREHAARQEPQRVWSRPRIVHRTDRETSGVLLVGKTPAAERTLSSHFEHGEVRKEYCALVAGVLAPAGISVDLPIAKARAGRMRIHRNGKSSQTDFEVIERFAEATWVRAKPRTGRMHQIRLHARAIGHPLLGDSLYGYPAESIGRLALHAWRYTLPESWGETRRFEAELPEDIRSAIHRLRS